jgi:hypothetical protein
MGLFGQAKDYLKGQANNAINKFDGKGAGSAVGGAVPFKEQRESLGKITGGKVGSFLGGLGGKLVGAITGNKDAEQKGKDFGSAALGFRKGGRVKKGGKYLVHKREYIVPKKTKVSKKQKKTVAKRQKKKTKKGKK